MASNTRKRNGASELEGSAKRLRIDHTIVPEGTSNLVEAVQ